MADIFTDNITLTKGTKTKITLNTALKEYFSFGKNYEREVI